MIFSVGALVQSLDFNITQALEAFNALPLALLTLDHAGRVHFANAAAEQFFNQSAHAMRHRALTALLPVGSPIPPLLTEARQQGASYAEHGLEVTTPGGQRAVIDLFIAPITDPPDGQMVTLHPRSVAAKLNRQLNNQGAARSVVGVAAMLAHEIRNPLSGIRGAAQLLEEGSADPQEQELTTLICREVDRIRALVDRMESFSDTRPLECRPENIHRILGHVQQVAQSGFARGIPIRERYDPSLPKIMGNHDKLVQVFLNLIKNAVEACPASGGEIILTSAYRPGVRVAARGTVRRVSLPLEVCVMDNGPGAPPDLREHLFEPFITSKPGGSGLGLALAAKIIGDHGGLIEYDRLHAEKMSVFRVLLPVSAP